MEGRWRGRRFAAFTAGVAVLGALTFRCGDETPAPPPTDEDRFAEAVDLRNVALAAMEREEWQAAIGHLQRMQELLPDNALPPINLGICHYRTGNDEAAREALNAARATAPDSPELLYVLALVLENLGSAAQADHSSVLADFATRHPDDPRPGFLESRWRLDRDEGPEALAAATAALTASDSNLVLMALWLEAAGAARSEADLRAAYDAIVARLDGVPKRGADFFARFVDALDRGEIDAAASMAVGLRNVIKGEPLYAIHLVEVEGQNPGHGALFPMTAFVPALPKRFQGGLDIEIQFARASDWEQDWGATRQVVAAADGSRDAAWFINDDGLQRVTADQAPGTIHRDHASLQVAVSGDVDQDGIPDLIGVDEAGLHWWRASVEGQLEAEPRTIRTSEMLADIVFVVPVDLDHEGDLDLLILRANAADVLLQNSLSDDWKDITDATAVGGPARTSSAAACADFDDDGDLDLVITSPEAAPRLLANHRSGPLEDVSFDFALDELAPAPGLLSADLDGDGVEDLLLYGPGGATLLRNDGRRFEAARLPVELEAEVRWVCAADIDNDADLDLIVGLANQVVMLRNRDSEFTVEDVGLPAIPAQQVTALDLDEDGDLDLLLRESTGAVQAWRNDGGNKNSWLRVRLRGKNDNNSKNNTQGRFARIDLRQGDLYSGRHGNGRVNHFGLAENREAQLLRVEWTNGVTQTWLHVASHQTLDEEQVLKGSCPFLFTWNGDRFEFCTDLMWSSPLGMVDDRGRAAPHQSAMDFVRIAPQMLQPANGLLTMQVTSELWEVSYFDQLELLAVDHPADQEVWVDERIVAPPYSSEPALHPVTGTGAHAPDRAWLIRPDGAPTDVTARLRDRDGARVTELPTTRYQGLTEPHSIELQFAAPPAGPHRLLLWGWTFPTDTSINVALSQDPHRSVQPPALDVQDANGEWQEIVPFTGFPKGKRKCVVIDLPGLEVVDGPVNLRLRTTMQIYWDRIALAGPPPTTPLQVHRARPVFADLHGRGFSRPIPREDGEPHLFEYTRPVSSSPWPTMKGPYTRYGTVHELLRDADDRSVVMAPGDEITVHFQEPAPPPEGWRRTYVLYSDGWVKDADLNTTASATVAPHPYHEMNAYPGTPHQFPDTPLHQQYWSEFQTRHLDDRPFRESLRGSTHAEAAGPPVRSSRSGTPGSSTPRSSGGG